MSDGPYKTLNMSRPWKRLAKVAANAAHSRDEVIEAWRPALLDEWNSAVRPAFAQEVRAALADGQFHEMAVAETGRLRALASNAMEALLADHARDVCRDGQVGDNAYHSAIKSCLDEHAARRARQIEEHFLRASPRSATRLRAELGASIGAVGTDQLAAGIVAGAGARSLAPKVDRSGLDEGVVL